MSLICRSASTAIPTEIHREILASVTVKSLVSCTAVSRQWRCVALSMGRVWSEHRWKIGPAGRLSLDSASFWLSLSKPHSIDVDFQLTKVTLSNCDLTFKLWCKIMAKEAARIARIQFTGRAVDWHKLITYFDALPSLRALAITFATGMLPISARTDTSAADTLLHSAKLRSLVLDLPMFGSGWSTPLPSSITSLPWNNLTDCNANVPSIEAFLDIISWASSLEKLKSFFKCRLDERSLSDIIISRPSIRHLSILSIGNSPAVFLRSLRLPGLLNLYLDGDDWSVADISMIIGCWRCVGLQKADLVVTSIPVNIHQHLQHIFPELLALTISTNSRDGGMVRLVSALAEHDTLLPKLSEANFYDSTEVSFRLAQRFVFSRLGTLKYLGVFDLDVAWPPASRDWLKRMEEAGTSVICHISYLS